MIFPEKFDLEVSEEIIKEGTPNDQCSCALAMAIRYNVPSDIYVQTDIGYGYVHVNERKVTIEIDDYYIAEHHGGHESAYFTFTLSDELYDWMNDFDNEKYVPPITVECQIDDEDFSENLTSAKINGTMRIKDHKETKEVVWSLVMCDEHMIQNDEGKYDWQIDSEVVRCGKFNVSDTFSQETIREMASVAADFCGDFAWRETEEHEYWVSDGPDYEHPWSWTELRWHFKEETK